ncbi:MULTISPECIES: hypothetical protein [Aeromonas]|uniref:hypothetical protein n=1 Tax=Aeromonas TaxID=642 RepID=UPI002A75C170|nr:hypothetical protein [Aeromonas jandaei]
MDKFIATDISYREYQKSKHTGNIVNSFIKKHSLNICFVLLGFYISAVFFAYSYDTSSSFLVVLNNIGTFLGSAGALAAILTILNIFYKQQEEKEEREVNYLKYIAFILDRQLTIISLYELNSSKFMNIDEAKRALALPAYRIDETLLNVIDIEKCLFLLSSPNEQLLAELDRSQRNFKSLFHTISTRNEVYINQYHSKMHSLFRHDEEFTLNELEGIVGKSLLPSLTELTNEIYINVPNVKTLIQSMFTQTLAELKRKYPHRNFIEP